MFTSEVRKQTTAGVAGAVELQDLVATVSGVGDQPYVEQRPAEGVGEVDVVDVEEVGEVKEEAVEVEEVGPSQVASPLHQQRRRNRYPATLTPRPAHRRTKAGCAPRAPPFASDALRTEMRCRSVATAIRCQHNRRYTSDVTQITKQTEPTQYLMPTKANGNSSSQSESRHAVAGECPRNKTSPYQINDGRPPTGHDRCHPGTSTAIDALAACRDARARAHLVEIIFAALLGSAPPGFEPLECVSSATE